MAKQPLKHGTVGESHVWDGPLDVTGFPMGKGSSFGKNGMQIKKYPCDPVSGLPITEIAKQRS